MIGRYIGGILLGLAVLVGTATLRMISDGKAHLDEARRLLESGNRQTAVTYFEDAAKAYVPGSPYPKRALQELRILAKGAEMRGDLLGAVTIWEAMRRAAIATRHLYQPNQTILVDAEREIVRLRGFKQPSETNRPNPIQRPQDPTPLGAIALFIGVVSWIFGAIVLCLIPPSRQLTHSIRRKGAWIACLGGLALWVTMAWIVE